MQDYLLLHWILKILAFRLKFTRKSVYTDAYVLSQLRSFSKLNVLFQFWGKN